MLAILDRDIIISLTIKGDTEIGTIPADKKGVGLDRLRFDGEKIVDLADLTELWVEAVAPDFFICHAIEVQGSQKVIMSYQDRKNLMIDNGTIRLKTAAEITVEKEAQNKTMIKNRLRQAFKRDVGDPEDALADAWKIIALLIVQLRTGDLKIDAFLAEILPDLQAAYPFDTVKDGLADSVKTIKTLMEGYRAEIESKG